MAPVPTDVAHVLPYSLLLAVCVTVTSALAIVFLFVQCACCRKKEEKTIEPKEAEAKTATNIDLDQDGAATGQEKSRQAPPKVGVKPSNKLYKTMFGVSKDDDDFVPSDKAKPSSQKKVDAGTYVDMGQTSTKETKRHAPPKVGVKPSNALYKTMFGVSKDDEDFQPSDKAQPSSQKKVDAGTYVEMGQASTKVPKRQAPPKVGLKQSNELYKTLFGVSKDDEAFQPSDKAQPTSSNRQAPVKVQAGTYVELGSKKAATSSEKK